MGLVEYSDSEEESGPETLSGPAAAAAAAGPAPPKPSSKSKPAFEKVVDRSNPRKIRVNLPQLSNNEKATNGGDPEDESQAPPAKRARTGGGAFSGFNSFLPAPKRAVPAAGGASTLRRGIGGGVSLKTGAAPGFSREPMPSAPESEETPTENDKKDGNGDAASSTNTSSTTATVAREHKSAPGPSIPAQKSAEQVKKVGNPMMFKPLSVAGRKPQKKKTATNSPASVSTSTTSHAVPSPSSQTQTHVQTTTTAAAPPKPKPKPKVSLFSLGDAATESPVAGPSAAPPTGNGGDYTPLLYETNQPPSVSQADPYTAYDTYQSYDSSQTYPPQSTYPTSAAAPHSQSQSQSLSSIAQDLNLSESAKRQLFGRAATKSKINNTAFADPSAISVVNFNTDEEYQANEALRAAGETVQHNPVRSIAPGKHSLKQLVNAASSQRDALEESFATGKRNKAEAGSKYGW